MFQVEANFPGLDVWRINSQKSALPLMNQGPAQHIAADKQVFNVIWLFAAYHQASPLS